ncbi:unnamed protein product [Notodromas monacha]|uniref:Mpv17-like protein 2 n=1 Tax=Notodromas monacha TaxID=399045 RepID=A0A7R9BQ86_9CRUS|nr:unnamed protein product [Notodromas monacha]CAG0918334.1 unnamed protein product [Notodromas monacha]
MMNKLRSVLSMKRSLWATNVVGTGVLYATGDSLLQALEVTMGGKKSADWDPQRTCKIENHPEHVPLNMVVTMVTNLGCKPQRKKERSPTLEMKPLLVSLREFAYKYPRVYLMDLCIWPPTMYLNFLFVPGQYRVLVVNCANILWTAFLSFVKHAQHEVGPTGLVFEELVPFGRF